jgi:hypothetical protein
MKYFMTVLSNISHGSAIAGLWLSAMPNFVKKRL